MSRIYLDNAATTAIDPKVIESMNKSYSSFGNPSSLHSFGQEARQAVDEARDIVCQFLNCKPTEIIFTSGGSESDNLAIRGIVDAWYSKLETRNSKLETNPNDKNSKTGSRIKPHKGGPLVGSGMTQILPHVIIPAIEHHAVLHTVQDLEKNGKVEATYIKPGKNGIVRVEDIKSAIQPNTVLISVMYVNNEIGTVQPVREIGKMIERENTLRAKSCHSERVKRSEESSEYIERAASPRSFADAQDDKCGRIYFHTDAVQAAEFLDLDVKRLFIDLLTMTAHKIHGPKGAGLLFVKKGTPITPQIVGGEHEFRLRAGTENVAGIVGMAEAIRLTQITDNRIQKSVIPAQHKVGQTPAGIQGMDPRVKPEDDNYFKIKRLRDKLEDSILKNIPDTYLNGDREKRAPHITNISFKNAEGEAIILNLDFLGIAVSSGSACTARSLEPSHVLSAIDIPHELSHGAIRFSLSRETTDEEIDKVLEVLPGVIKKLREMSPFN